MFRIIKMVAVTLGLLGGLAGGFAAAQNASAESAPNSAGAAAQAGAAAADDPAASDEDKGDVACLWGRLDPHFRLRLELATRWGGEDPAQLIARVDPTALHRLSVNCGFAANRPMMGLVAQYWSVRAAEAGLAAELRRVGVSVASAERALATTAPADARRALAVEIMGRDGASAQRSIRAAIGQVGVERGGVKVPAETPALLARYFATKILIDGLEAGARAPELD